LTKNPRELDQKSTQGAAEDHILNLIMRGAFVVQVLRVNQEIAGHMEGLIEEVDTGKQSQFRSEDELIGFLRDRFARMGQSFPGKERPEWT
jgi:hypothetical protein